MAWSPDYVDTETFMDYVSGDFDVLDSDNDEAALAVSAASRAVDRATRRQFGKVDAPEVRRYVARRAWHGWVLDIDDVHADVVGAVLIDGIAPATVPEFWPLNKPIKTQMEVSGCGTYAVTLAWGWPAVPDTVVQGTLLQGARFFARRNAPFGIAGSPESGSEMRLLAKADPDVVLMLQSYRRNAVPR